MSARPYPFRHLRLLLVSAAAIITAAGGAAACSPPPNGPTIARQIAFTQLHQRGWDNQAVCLNNLWNQESGWNVYALNTSSGAYGIPQSLPANKMGSAGPDWLTNPATQIRWGLDYIASRYGNPCNAWNHERAFNWYSVDPAAPVSTR